MTPKKKMLPINLYVIMIPLGFILWIVTPEWGQFIGASSLWDAIILFASADNRFLAVLALFWLPVFIIGLTISYIFACKYQKNIPFLVFSGGDLIVSLLFILYKICMTNYTGLFIMLVGVLVRAIYYIWMVVFVQKTYRFSN